MVTKSSEQRTANSEQRTANSEQRTALKQWSKIMLLCLISTTFWQCQKEDDLQGTHFGKNLKTTQTKYLEGEEALKIQNLLNSELEKSNQRIYSKNSSSMRTDYGTIDFSTIMEVIDTIGIRNYTFRIKNHPEEDHNTFFNLVVNVYNDQSIVFLMRYDMSDNYASLLEEGITTPGGFEGVVTPTIITTEHPCPQIEEPITITPTNPNNPIGGGGEGPGDPGGQPSQPSQPDGGGEQGNEPVFAEPCGFTVRVSCCHGIHYGEYDGCKCPEGDKGAIYFVTCRPDEPETNTEPCPDLGDVGIVLPEEIILDPTFKNNPCLKGVYDGMVQNSTIANNYLNNFDSTMSLASLIFAGDSTLDANTNAQTSPPVNYLIKITFNTNNLNRPQLSIARTFIHELIHAEIFRKLLSISNHPSINLTNLDLNLIRENFPGIFDYYVRYKFNVPAGQVLEDPQHQMMAQHYRDIISNAIKEYDNNQHPQNLYDALAWSGLMGEGVIDMTTGLTANPTVAWQNLSQADRLNIINTINTFDSSNTNCQ